MAVEGGDDGNVLEVDTPRHATVGAHRTALGLLFFLAHFNGQALEQFHDSKRRRCSILTRVPSNEG